MSGSTNSTTREPRVRDPQVLVEVFSAFDLPDPILAPDGIMRVPLVLGVKYEVHKTFVWPLLLIPTSPGPGPAFTEIAGVSQNVQMLVASGLTPFMWGRGVGNFRLNNMLAVDILGFNSTLLDLTGIPPDIDPSKTSNALFILNFGIFAFDYVGRVVDMAVNIDRSGWAATRGLVARAVGFSALPQVATNYAHINLGVPTETPVLTYQGPQNSGAFTVGALVLGVGSSSFNIDTASGGDFGISDSPGAETPTSGNFFRPDVSKAITEFAPANVAFASVENSTLAPGVDSTIRFSTIQNKFVRGQVVRLKGGTGATYDGLHTIVRVSPDQMGFDVGVVFVATDTGNVEFTRVTAAGHGLVDGESNTISGTTNYEDTTNLFEVDEDNFDITTAFVADDPGGTVTSVNKNEESIGITVSLCGRQKDSKSIGSLHARDNTVTTIITNTGDWVDLNLDTAHVSSNIQRFELANATTGELRNVDNKEFDGWYEAVVTAMSSAAIEQFQFRVVVDDSPTVDDVVFGIELKANTESITVLAPVTLAADGGRARLQARNMDGTSDLEVQQLSVRIQ